MARAACSGEATSQKLCHPVKSEGQSCSPPGKSGFPNSFGIRFVRARRPTEDSPIGLAFDDVGSTNSDLWDVLVRELRGMPSVYFLGSVRQEDVTLIANQSDTEFIAVSLDEVLAETVWRKLHAEDQTNWEHWREPFEQSEGLMLEHVHLLTQGRRLAAVIDEQVRQRREEGRHDELAIIRSTAVLCARGAEVHADLLRVRRLLLFIHAPELGPKGTPKHQQNSLYSEKDLPIRLAMKIGFYSMFRLRAYFL